MKYFALLVLLLSATANATIITIEPDDYAHGTVILPSDGASISFIHHAFHARDFTSRAAIAAFEITCVDTAHCSAPTGTHILSDGTLRDGELARGATRGLAAIRDHTTADIGPDALETLGEFVAVRVDFAAPTKYFGADLFSFHGDSVALYAFAQDGTFLSRILSDTAGMQFIAPNCDGPGSTCARHRYNMQVWHDTADIAFVIFGSTDAQVFADAVRFEVPEPSTIALFGLGLAGFAVRRRAGTRRKVGQ
jgi:hypothetical protein